MENRVKSKKDHRWEKNYTLGFPDINNVVGENIERNLYNVRHHSER